MFIDLLNLNRINLIAFYFRFFLTLSNRTLSILKSYVKMTYASSHRVPYRPDWGEVGRWLKRRRKPVLPLT